MDAEFTTAGRRWAAGPRRKRKGFFLRAETLFNLAQNVSGLPGFWDADLTLQAMAKGSSPCSRRCLPSPAST